MPEDPKMAQPPGEPDEEIRVGVYTCHCGGNIADVVHCERVASALRQQPGVAVSRTHMAMCSDAGQSLIEEDIREHGVNRVVVGACAPSLHEQTFRGTVARAGLNPYLYCHVGVREQSSWVHSSEPEKATDKAIRLMLAGVAKARLLSPLDPIRLDAAQHALVIGGGVAGLRAALDIARQGLRATLIEKSPFLGGRMAQLESMFPSGEPARSALHELAAAVLAHPRIVVHTNAELVGVKGYVGDFQVQIRQVARGVSEDMSAFHAAAAACPVAVADEFNYGLTTRKAIYRRYDGCFPATPAIDWENCTRCGECLKVPGVSSGQSNGQGISLEETAETFDIQVGAVVVATGFDLYEPPVGEYGYGELPEVVTLAKFIRLLALTGAEEELTWNGRPVRDVAFIHCVGSRQIDGVNQPQPDGEVNDYCSRVCCTATLHTIGDLKERFPGINVFDVYEDIRTYGRGHEDYYTDACANRVCFLRFLGREMPEVLPAPAGDAYPVLINVKDTLTFGETIEVPADLVVLAAGVMPRQVEDLISILKIPPGTDRFMLEVHPKLRPVETPVPGIVLAGTAQGPMNIHESCAAASAAATKVAVLLGQGVVESQPYVAWVDPDRCQGSGECVEVCCYEDAIALQTVTVDGRQVQRAVVTPANCVGCGACVSACPHRAIDVQGWALAQYEAMVDAIAADLPVEEVSV